jgi:hypothetical protein
MHFQAARQEAISARNIESAWRAVGLIPYNPSPILEKYRPKTPPFRDAIDGNGVEKINEMVAQLLRVCPTPHRSKITFIRDTALTALADKEALQFMNEGLVKKSKEGRQNKTKKHFGTARVLTVEEALRIKEDREMKERQMMAEKEKAAALRGKIGFAKMVWKEGYQMGIDLFN